MKVFTSSEFIDKLKWLTYDVPNVYYSGSNWSKLNKSGKWQFDCVVSIKSILWGFRADKNLSRGGTVYLSNGVADFTCNGALNYCSWVSNDFHSLIPGEYLCMKDTKYNHSGIYLGNGKVFECTTGWGVNKCIISDINSDGVRSYNGKKNLKWTYHGLLEYIDYSETPIDKIRYQAFDYKKKYWLPWVYAGDGDYAGNYGNPISGFRINKLRYRAHDMKKGYWLPWVNGLDDYAGNLPNPIDGVQIECAKYRVHLKNGKWLPWVDKVDDTNSGYAGIYGRMIDAIEIK